MSSPLSRVIRTGAPQCPAIRHRWDYRRTAGPAEAGHYVILSESMSGTVHQKFSAALNDLVEQIKQDRSILAAILCGSLSHDTVWAKSDIDLVLVTVDDRTIATSDIALNADG